ncbi:MAG: DUF1330 domain-containing protein [Gammaproteobacteria bacterium]|nr:DUF1330 domain-containing protein [Gammaproteobacteria bacterium]MCP5200914.1 DUF1330 domain-containing protein [Gammaproteobacteria bacterium]
MTTATIEPTAEQLQAFATAFADTGPVTMLNLLRYRAQADYSGHPAATPCSGRQAYARYAAEALACVEGVGGRVVYAGAAGAGVIGPVGEAWDDVLLVEYPGVDAFLDMVRSPRYQACVHHRSAALADSRLVPTSAGRSAYRE